MLGNRFIQQSVRSKQPVHLVQKLKERASLRREKRREALSFSYSRFLVEFMNDQSTSQLRFEPRSFGWHNFPAVSYVHNLFHADGVES